MLPNIGQLPVSGASIRPNPVTRVSGWVNSRLGENSPAAVRGSRQLVREAGELTEAEAGMLVRSFLSAGIDTTVYGLGNALYCFAQFGEHHVIRIREVLRHFLFDGAPLLRPV